MEISEGRARKFATFKSAVEELEQKVGRSKYEVCPRTLVVYDANSWAEVGQHDEQGMWRWNEEACKELHFEPVARPGGLFAAAASEDSPMSGTQKLD